MILFLHAATVSLAATEARLQRTPAAPRIRHALVPELVDPSAASFAEDEADYQRIRSALKTHLQGDESGVVLSCSVFNGFALRLAAELGLPVERSDDAGIRAALACGPRIGLAVSYPPSYRIIEDHLQAVAGESGRTAAPVPLLDQNAFAYADDVARYSAVLADAAARAEGVDSIFLAQFSMDPFAAEVARRTQVPVISALEACLLRLSSAREGAT